MSVKSRALASISTALLAGWAALATGTLASRLSEKAWPTASACGVPGAARWPVFLAISWIWLPTRRNSATLLPPIWPAYRRRSPTLWLTL